MCQAPSPCFLVWTPKLTDVYIKFGMLIEIHRVFAHTYIVHTRFLHVVVKYTRLKKVYTCIFSAILVQSASPGLQGGWGGGAARGQCWLLRVVVHDASDLGAATAAVATGTLLREIRCTRLLPRHTRLPPDILWDVHTRPPGDEVDPSTPMCT